MNILLITEEDIKRDSPIGGNVDINKLFPAIKQAQITMIKPFIGKPLYDKLIQDFSTDNLTGLYEEMYNDYIKSMLIHISTAFYLTYGAYEIGNKGVYKASSETATGLSREEIDYMVKAQEKYYEAYKKGLKKFLDNNYKDIPEWTTKDKTRTKRVKIGGWSLAKKPRPTTTVSPDIYVDKWGQIKW